MATVKKGARKAAPKKASKSVSGNSVKKMPSMFKLEEGVPIGSMLRSTEDERNNLYKILKDLKPKRNHFVVPSRLKTTTLRLAERDFPEYKMRTSLNKEKGTVSVWREA